MLVAKCSIIIIISSLLISDLFKKNVLSVIFSSLLFFLCFFKLDLDAQIFAGSFLVIETIVLAKFDKKHFRVSSSVVNYSILLSTMLFIPQLRSLSELLLIMTIVLSIDFLNLAKNKNDLRNLVEFVAPISICFLLIVTDGKISQESISPIYLIFLALVCGVFRGRSHLIKNEYLDMVLKGFVIPSLMIFTVGNILNINQVESQNIVLGITVVMLFFLFEIIREIIYFNKRNLETKVFTYSIFLIIIFFGYSGHLLFTFICLVLNFFIYFLLSEQFKVLNNTKRIRYKCFIYVFPFSPIFIFFNNYLKVNFDQISKNEIVTLIIAFSLPMFIYIFSDKEKQIAKI